MADWPTSLSNFGSDVLTGQIVLPEHVNKIRAELLAFQKSMAAADSGTLDPANINDSLLTASYDAAILVSGILRVGGVLDVLASQLKKIIDTAGNYKTAPAISLAQLKVPTFLTLTTEANLTNGVKLADVMRVGTLAARPNANAVAAGVHYFATDKQIEYRSDGATWATVGFYPTGTLAQDSLFYWDATNGKFVVLTPPTSGTVYLQHGVSGWVFSGLPANYQVLQSPSVYDPATKIHSFFNTAQECLDAAPSYTEILLIPGTYNETLTKSTDSTNIVIREILPNSVTLNGRLIITGEGVVSVELYNHNYTSATSSDTHLVELNNAAAQLNYRVKNITINGSNAGKVNLFKFTDCLTPHNLEFDNLYYSNNAQCTWINTYGKNPTVRLKFTGLEVYGSVYRIVYMDAGTVYMWGGGKFINQLQATPTFTVDGGTFIVSNIDFPSGTVLPTNYMSGRTSDRVSRLDVEAVAGLMYAFNNFI